MLKFLGISGMLLTMGCGGGVPVNEMPPALPVYQPYIGWDVTLPRTDVGQSTTGAGSGLWSVAPEGGNIYGLTFNHVGLGLRFEVPRSFFSLGEIEDVADAGLFVQLDSISNYCTTWQGTYIVQSDMPNWSVVIHAQCMVGQDIAVEGRWFGYPEGIEPAL